MKKDIRSFDFKFLEKENISDLLMLQSEVFNNLKDERLLRKNTAETFKPCFVAPSVVLGAFYKGELAAVGILLYPDKDEDLSFYVVGTPPSRNCANLKLTIVKPSFVGNGLQINLLNRLEEYALRQGTEVLLATVSPLNVFSLSNLIAAGYEKNTTIKKYGSERFLMIKKIVKQY